VRACVLVRASVCACDSASICSHACLHKRPGLCTCVCVCVGVVTRWRARTPSFNYYGMRAVLSLYLVNALLMSQDQATTWIHAFSMLAYFFPLFGPRRPLRSPPSPPLTRLCQTGACVCALLRSS
jgi:hypothetical protein